jgi:hypothetical protein
LLSFDDWLKIWRDSGRLAERGRKRGQYCMARFKDSGPYAVGNVKIILSGDNLSEAQLGCLRSEKHKEAIRRSKLGIPRSKEVRAKMSLAAKLRQPRIGWKHTEETKDKMRKEALKRPAWSCERKAEYAKIRTGE